MVLVKMKNNKTNKKEKSDTFLQCIYGSFSLLVFYPIADLLFLSKLCL